jgi:hypothetical protein
VLTFEDGSGDQASKDGMAETQGEEAVVSLRICEQMREKVIQEFRWQRKQAGGKWDVCCSLFCHVANVCDPLTVDSARLFLETQIRNAG